MFAIEVNFLTGRYTAHSQQGYGTHEWPPHPGRLFSALTAAYHQHGFGKKHRELLKCIEQLPSPKLFVPEAYERDTVTVWVPHVYDEEYLKKEADDHELGQVALRARSSRFSESRANKQKEYPTILPDGPVYFIWDHTIPDGLRKHLNDLVTSIPYLGDSSSLVHARLEEDPPQPNLFPAKSRRPEQHLRVPVPGRLEDLEEAYNRGDYPRPSKYVGYTSDVQTPSKGPEPPGSGFGSDSNFIVLKISDGPKPPLQVAFDVTQSLRRAILAIVDDPIPTWISGHSSCGGPAKHSPSGGSATESEHDLHISIVPLSHTATQWGDGSILGVGILVPDSVDAHERQTLHDAIDELRPISVGSRGDIAYQIDASPTKASLKRGPYAGPSTLWTTVTPYVYDRYPETDQDRDEMIASACEHIGLPQPKQVHVIEHGVSPLTGVPNAESTRLDGTRFSSHPRRHVVIQFEEPVQGPITIGRGRFLGIGLMRRLKRDEGDNQ